MQALAIEPENTFCQRMITLALADMSDFGSCFRPAAQAAAMLDFEQIPDPETAGFGNMAGFIVPVSGAGRDDNDQQSDDDDMEEDGL
jgi:hypothetical protein